MLHPMILLVVFIFGTVIGSFLNVVIYRTPVILLALWPEEEEDLEIPAGFLQRFVFACRYLGWDLWWSIAYLFKDIWQEAKHVLKGISFPASHCGNCQTPIAWYDNLPVLSWFILGGRCRHCQQAYSARYPLIEFLSGLLFVYVYWLKGPGLDFALWSLVVAGLWAIFWIDIDTQFVFNVMTYPSIFLGILYNGTNANLKWSLAGGLIAWLLFESVMFLSLWLLGKEGMGGGDVKLAILIGVWLGPAQLMVALSLAFVIGTLIGIMLLLRQGQSKPFPFGPFLVMGMLFAMSVGDRLWSWYIDKSIWYLS